MSVTRRPVRVLRQLPRFAQRNCEARGKRFAPDVKVPETNMQVLSCSRLIWPGAECFDGDILQNIPVETLRGPLLNFRRMR